MLHHRDDSAGPVWTEWHEMRQLYRTILFDVSEAGAVETEKYDLESAKITGKRNPRTYITEPFDPSFEHPRDIREDPRF